MISEKLHSEEIWGKVLPSTVLPSFSNSLAMILTESLVLVIRDWWKFTYLEANITLGCKDLLIDSIRYLWVHLSTSKACLIETFQDLNILSQPVSFALKQVSGIFKRRKRWERKAPLLQWNGISFAAYFLLLV